MTIVNNGVDANLAYDINSLEPKARVILTVISRSTDCPSARVIAERSGVSLSTVRRHLSVLRRKDLVVMASPPCSSKPVWRGRLPSTTTSVILTPAGNTPVPPDVNNHVQPRVRFTGREALSLSGRMGAVQAASVGADKDRIIARLEAELASLTAENAKLSAQLRSDPRHLIPSAPIVLTVGDRAPVPAGKSAVSKRTGRCRCEPGPNWSKYLVTCPDCGGTTRT